MSRLQLRRVTSRLIALVGGAVIFTVSGCASGSLERAKNADELHEYDVSVAEYTKAVREHPDSQAARLGLETSKLRASDAHFARGERLSSQGRLDDAIVELQIAADLNPTNANAARALRDARTAQREKLTKEAEGNPTALEQLLASQRTLTTPGYALSEVPLGELIQTGENTTARQVYLAIARGANLSVTFDQTFQDRPAPVSLLANTMTIRQALNSVARSTNTFYQVTGPNTIIVVPNTPAKQNEYQQQVVQVFYVQNTDAKELTDFLRTVADARFLGIVAGVHAISVRDTPERVAMIGRLIAAVDKARPEVVVDVEVLEVDRTKLEEYGLQIASNTSAGQSPGLNGSVNVTPDPSSVAALQALSPANVLVTGIPALYYRLLKTDTNTRTLANPHLRMTDGVQGLAEFGESVPVPTTTFAPVQQGGPTEQAVTSFTYKNVGVSITMTPQTHANDDVSLSLDVVLNDLLAATGFQGLPEFTNRHVTTTIRLKDGETNILAGLIQNNEVLERDGFPGLSSIPGLRDVFSKTHKERDETDVVLMLTPHIIHGLGLTEDDLRPLLVPRDGAGLGELQPVAPGPGRGGGGGEPPASLPLASLPLASLPPASLPLASLALASTAPAAPVGGPSVAATPTSASVPPGLPVAPGWPIGLAAVPLSPVMVPIKR
jgi:general secretion pathway protein D